MLVGFSFTVKTGDGKMIESPTIWAGEVSLLEKLFPGLPIWKCKKSDLGNQMYPTVEEMESLYGALLEYVATNEVSGELFPVANIAGGGSQVERSDRSLFQRIIKFCEEKLDFSRAK